MSERRTVVVTSTEGKLTQRIEVGPHVLSSDEPPDAGNDEGPSPYELLLAALGSCTSMTLEMYARHKQWSLEAVTIRLTYNRAHVEDCEDGETVKRRVHEIDRQIEVRGDLDQAQRERLREIAERCPVHRTLIEEKRIATRVSPA